MRFKNTLMAIAAFASLLAAGAGNATELITNGNFETGDLGQINTGGRQLAGWSTNGYNFVFNASHDDTNGVTGTYGNLKLWGPGNGAANGLKASPVGGNYVGADGAYEVGALTQLVTGLNVGQQYQLSFYWAGAQQYGYDGVTTELWKVSFGNDKFTTTTVTDANHGFTGWKQEAVTFTATSTSELLSFLAAGTPNGEPPFSLLDGVSMTAVPEPGTLALMGLGLGLLSFGARRRKSSAQSQSQ